MKHAALPLFVWNKTPSGPRAMAWTRAVAHCAPALMTLPGTLQSVSQTTAEPKSVMPMSILVARLATNFASRKDDNACMRKTTPVARATWMERIPGRMWVRMDATRTGITKYVAVRDRQLVTCASKSDGLPLRLDLESSELRRWPTKLQSSQHRSSPLNQLTSTVGLSVDEHALT